MQNKIYIGGNIYGAGNIGDDAVLQGIFRILEASAPEAVITVGTYYGNRLEYLPPSLKYVKSFDMTQVHKAIKRSDCFISGGGTMIGDELSPLFPLAYNAQLISIAKFRSKKVSMLAIGANRLQNKSNLKTARTILDFCDLVTSRDEPSRNVCIELGSNPKNTFVTADPAFLLNAKETTRTKELKKHLGTKGKVFGVNVVNEAWSHIGTYKMEIAKACDYICSQYGYTPVFFCNEVRPGNFFDFNANRQTAALLNCRYELLEPIYYSPEEMIDILSSFEFVISMRMHGLIFAAIAGVPFVSISRVDKVDNFMSLFGLKPSGSIDKSDCSQLTADIERLLHNKDSFQKQITPRISALRQECLRNVELFNNLINRHKENWRKVSAFSLVYLLCSNKTFQRIQRLLHGEISFSQVLQKLFHTSKKVV